MADFFVCYLEVFDCFCAGWWVGSSSSISGIAQRGRCGCGRVTCHFFHSMTTLSLFLKKNSKEKEKFHSKIAFEMKIDHFVHFRLDDDDAISPWQKKSSWEEEEKNPSSYKKEEEGGISFVVDQIGARISTFTPQAVMSVRTGRRRRRRQQNQARPPPSTYSSPSSSPSSSSSSSSKQHLWLLLLLPKALHDMTWPVEVEGGDGGRR